MQTVQFTFSQRCLEGVAVHCTHRCSTAHFVLGSGMVATGYRLLLKTSPVCGHLQCTKEYYAPELGLLLQQASDRSNMALSARAAELAFNVRFMKASTCNMAHGLRKKSVPVRLALFSSWAEVVCACMETTGSTRTLTAKACSSETLLRVIAKALEYCRPNIRSNRQSKQARCLRAELLVFMT